MEEMGGLIKTMPQTALLFLIGSAAIAALPPLNGFASEWMVFQALLVSASMPRSEEHTSELQSQSNLVCRLLLEKKKKKTTELRELKQEAHFQRLPDLVDTVEALVRFTGNHAARGVTARETTTTIVTLDNSTQNI